MSFPNVVSDEILRNFGADQNTSNEIMLVLSMGNAAVTLLSPGSAPKVLEIINRLIQNGELTKSTINALKETRAEIEDQQKKEEAKKKEEEKKKKEEDKKKESKNN